MKIITLTEKDIQRFWNLVDIKGSDECWMWKGACDGNGYGRLTKGNDANYARASRVAWIVTNGDIPEGLCACHKCDHPSCCNPNHIFLGTHKENMMDMERKGRGNKAKGTRQHSSKLKEEDVFAIRNLLTKGYPVKEIAKIFEVSRAAINKIKKNKSWAWLEK